MKKQLNMLLGTALFTVVAISSAMAGPGNSMSDSFMDADLYSSQTFKQYEVLKRSVNLENVLYDSDSDDEGDEVEKRLSRQNSQENLNELQTPDVVEPTPLRKSVVENAFETFSNGVSTIFQTVKSFFSRWF